MTKRKMKKKREIGNDENEIIYKHIYIYACEVILIYIQVDEEKRQVERKKVTWVYIWW